uniref:DDHD domain-containing protein n=1 Tax=Panagrellus redivivus TaxID=6233 RepID=A0A7E4VS55_PANRE
MFPALVEAYNDARYSDWKYAYPLIAGFFYYSDAKVPYLNNFLRNSPPLSNSTKTKYILNHGWDSIPDARFCVTPMRPQDCFKVRLPKAAAEAAAAASSAKDLREDIHALMPLLTKARQEREDLRRTWLRDNDGRSWEETLRHHLDPANTILVDINAAASYASDYRSGHPVKGSLCLHAGLLLGP